MKKGRIASKSTRFALFAVRDSKSNFHLEE